jgi:hypothetical protein
VRLVDQAVAMRNRGPGSTRGGSALALLARLRRDPAAAAGDHRTAKISAIEPQGIVDIARAGGIGDDPAPDPAVAPRQEQPGEQAGDGTGQTARMERQRRRRPRSEPPCSVRSTACRRPERRIGALGAHDHVRVPAAGIHFGLGSYRQSCKGLPIIGSQKMAHQANRMATAIRSRRGESETKKRFDGVAILRDLVGGRWR